MITFEHVTTTPWRARRARFDFVAHGRGGVRRLPRPQRRRQDLDPPAHHSRSPPDVRARDRRHVPERPHLRARSARCCAARSGSSTKTSACWPTGPCSRTWRSPCASWGATRTKTWCRAWRARSRKSGSKAKQERYPSELSAGEKQRAAIARAIVNRPAVLLADEPTGALEKKSADEILALLTRIHREGAALLLVTTNPAVAHAVGGRVLTIEEGRIVAGEPRMPRDSLPHAVAGADARLLLPRGLALVHAPSRPRRTPRSCRSPRRSRCPACSCCSRTTRASELQLVGDRREMVVYLNDEVNVAAARSADAPARRAVRQRLLRQQGSGVDGVLRAGRRPGAARVGRRQPAARLAPHPAPSRAAELRGDGEGGEQVSESSPRSRTFAMAGDWVRRLDEIGDRDHARRDRGRA